MLKLTVHLVVRADDENDIAGIAFELKRRIETQPALQKEQIRAIAVMAVEKAEG